MSKKKSTKTTNNPGSSLWYVATLALIFAPIIYGACATAGIELADLVALLGGSTP